ncbi:MAG: flagellar hook capping protein [Desulfobacterales bacterium]|nr:flagellar hook capping protein [Deltaproteobacteria bacterium]NNL40974.1 flagellar hook capping protein [Desulfobacterales bacterium]
MSVYPVDASNPNASKITSSKDSALGKDDFMNLLVAQLQNQDPLNPMDSTAFTSQLAEFSSLEQLSNVNENLEYLQMYQSSINNAQAVSFIGKNIDALGDSIQLENGENEEIHFELSADSSSVYVNIYNESGGLVKIIENGLMGNGKQSLEWDGTDNEGNTLPDGNYKYEVMAVDVNGDKVQTVTYINERVTGVTFKDGVTYLKAGGMEIPIGDVIEVSENQTS